ncbi:hypothetical protein K30_004 [Salmonella phage Kenya-K30]|nr:hypothetical protein K30_004 [Salmonella phage Kenya-K30]
MLPTRIAPSGLAIKPSCVIPLAILRPPIPLSSENNARQYHFLVKTKFHNKAYNSQT